MPLNSTKAGPAPLRIRLPVHVKVRADTPRDAVQSAPGQPEAPRSWEKDEEARSIARFRPFLRVAVVTVARPEPRVSSPDHYGLRRHLEEQRRPKVVIPPNSAVMTRQIN